MNKLFSHLFKVTAKPSGKDSVLFLKNTFLNFPEAIIVTTDKKQIVYINSKMEQLSGYSLSEVQNKKITYLLRSIVVRRTNRTTSKRFKKQRLNRISHFECRRKHDENLTLHAELFAVETDIHIGYWVYVLKDITLQKEKEKVLKSREGQYRLLFENNPIPMWIYDKKTFFFLAVNNAAVHHYGYSKKEFLSMTIWDIRPESESQRLKHFLKYFHKEVHNGLGSAGIWQHKKKDNTLITVETTYSQIRFNNVQAILVSINDVTEKQIAEEAAVELNRKISHILNSITDFFISVDTDYKITYINKRAEQLLGTVNKKAIGRVVWKEFPADFATLLEKETREAHKRMEVTKFDGIWIKNKWLRVHIYPSMQGVSLYMNDVTIEKEISQRKDEFISIASHELKTPLTSIKVYSQMLTQHTQKTDDRKLQEYVPKMNEQVDRLIELLNNLLDVGRIQTGKMVLKKEPFNMLEAVKRTVESISSTESSRRIIIKGDITHIVVGDKSRIEDVLTNLLTNAIKYSPPASKIHILLREEKDVLVVSVRDHGIGIPEDLQDKIFSRFYRVQNNIKSISGLGLGLYISKNIIRQHNGELWVKSKEGEGSTFSFSIPLK